MLAVLSGCAGTPESRKAPAFNYRSLQDQNSVLALALRATGNVPGTSSRVALYARIAREYRLANLPQDAVRVLDYAAALLIADPPQSDSIDGLLDLASGFAESGLPDRATPLLQEALAQTLAMTAEPRRVAALQKVIDTSFQAGEAGFDVLRQSVEAVFVIEDLWSRVTLLVSTAERYLKSENRQSVNSLLQQAIPAAGSLEDSVSRAAAYVRVARGFQDDGQTAQARELTTRAVELLRSPQISVGGPPDGKRAVEAVSGLAILGRKTDALAISDTLPAGAIRARAYAAVARTYTSEVNRQAAYIIFTRAIRQADGESDPFARAQAFAAIASGYREIGDLQLAGLQAFSAIDALAELPESTPASLALRRALLPVLVAGGDTAQIRRIESGVQSGHERALLLAEAGDLLLQDTGQTGGDAAGNNPAANDPATAVDEKALSFLDAARALASGSPPDQTVLSRVASIYVAASRPEEAVRTISLLTESQARARALAALGGALLSGQTLPPDAQQSLEAIREAVRAAG